MSALPKNQLPENAPCRDDGSLNTAQGNSQNRMPFSLLDLAMVPDGQTSADAFAATTELAQRADELGFTRIWVAEHHNMATVASTNPPILMAHLAANTNTIKVGSGGMMLPNHAPLIVAEQFALLEALYPGRIDLGIGRAPGTDRATALALRGTLVETSEDFPNNLIDVMGLLGDKRRDGGLWDRFSPTPNQKSTPSVILLGSSGFSAQLAGVLGLPFAFAHHFDMGGTVEAVSTYREFFEPSTSLSEPYVIVTGSVIAAATTEEAEFLARPAKLRRYGMRTGRQIPLLSPALASEHPGFADAMSMSSSAIIGDAEVVRDGLEGLRSRTEADEIMLYTATHSLDERLASLDIISSNVNLAPNLREADSSAAV